VVLSWNQTDYQSGNLGNTTTDAGNYFYNKTWSSGTGLSGQVPAGYSAVGQIWTEQTVLDSGGTNYYNITGLPVSVFGNSYVETINNVRLLYIENLSSGTGYNIAVRATGTNAFTNIFNGGSGNLVIGPNSPFLIGNYYTGFPVSATNKMLSIYDIGGSGATYKIGIIGI
jgi:hypothetical protein